jgi:hypothetical protein
MQGMLLAEVFQNAGHHIKGSMHNAAITLQHRY